MSKTLLKKRNQLKNNDTPHTMTIKNSVQLEFLDCFTNLSIGLTLKI